MAPWTTSGEVDSIQAEIPRSAARATNSTSPLRVCAITGPEAYSTVSWISASACSSSWWTTTIARSGILRRDQLDRLGDRDDVRRDLVAEPLEHAASRSSAFLSSSAMRTRRCGRYSPSSGLHGKLSRDLAQRPVRFPFCAPASRRAHPDKWALA